LQSSIVRSYLFGPGSALAVDGRKADRLVIRKAHEVLVEAEGRAFKQEAMR